MKVTLATWARLHGITRQRAAQIKGRLKTAEEIARGVWIVDSKEPAPEKMRPGAKPKRPNQRVSKLAR